MLKQSISDSDQFRHQQNLDSHLRAGSNLGPWWCKQGTECCALFGWFSHSQQYADVCCRTLQEGQIKSAVRGRGCKTRKCLRQF